MNEIQATLAFAPTSHGADNSAATFIYVVIALMVATIGLIGVMQTFAKTGQPRWGVLIPIYNVILLLRIAQWSGWWLLLLLVPIVSGLLLAIPVVSVWVLLLALPIVSVLVLLLPIPVVNALLLLLTIPIVSGLSLLLIPIANGLLLLQIAQWSGWWLLLLPVPIVNVLVTLAVSVDLAKVFGKGTGFGWGLAFLGGVFYPILGFGDAVYLPTAAQDPSDPFSPPRYFSKISAATSQRFNELGLSLVCDFQGRGRTVGIGRGSAVSGEHLSELIPLGMNELYLSRTSIGDESIAALQAMSQLRVLDLSHTQVTRDGIERLKELLPSTRIIG